MNKLITTISSVSLVVFVFLSFGIFAVGNVANAAESRSLNDYINPLGTQITPDSNVSDVVQGTFSAIANRTLSTVFGVIGILVLCMFVWAGLTYILARGDSKAVGNANNMMKFAVIGLLVVFGSYIILNFVFTLVGKF